MKRLAVFGRPVAHSLSPIMHHFWARAHEISLQYLRVRAETPERILPMAELLELDGFNVTAPFKETIMPFLSGVELVAKLLGAVNTVIRTGNGWWGLNTDPDGVIWSLSERDKNLKGKKALVIGAGGAAAASLLACKRLGLDATLVNRSPERATRLAYRFGVKVAPWADLKTVSQRCQVAIVAAPLDQPEELLNWLLPGVLILEADYRQGRLFRQAQSLGREGVINGREWLIGQGARAFQQFCEVELSADEMHCALTLLDVDSPRYGQGHICLVGLPGCGKSTVAAELAARSQRQVLDLDDMIAVEQGCSISEIFDRQSEAGFRELEQSALQRVLSRPAQLLSLGGGVVETEDNQQRLAGESGVTWLAMSPERALAQALVQGGRPLFSKSADAKQTMHMLQMRRKARYAAIADLVVDGQASIETIAGGIHEEMA